jgi:hypothetical protein
MPTVVSHKRRTKCQSRSVASDTWNTSLTVNQASAMTVGLLSCDTLVFLEGTDVESKLLLPFSETTSILKMETLCFSETLATKLKTTRRHNPEDYIYDRENVKSSRTLTSIFFSFFKG